MRKEVKEVNIKPKEYLALRGIERYILIRQAFVKTQLKGREKK